MSINVKSWIDREFTIKLSGSISHGIKCKIRKCHWRVGADWAVFRGRSRLGEVTGGLLSGCSFCKPLTHRPWKVHSMWSLEGQLLTQVTHVPLSTLTPGGMTTRRSLWINSLTVPYTHNFFFFFFLFFFFSSFCNPTIQYRFLTYCR